MSNLENRVWRLEELHRRHTPIHDHPDIGVHDGRLKSEIHPTAWLADCVTLGENCVIGPNVVIGNRGFGYERDGYGHYQWREHECGVIIEDDVEIGAGTVIDRGRYRDTRICRGTKIDANVFIAHNCLIGSHCLIIANSQISGSCEIGDGCHIGPAAILTDHVNVGFGARCGLGAVVTKNVPAGEVWIGNPAEEIGAFKVRRAAIQVKRVVEDEMRREEAEDKTWTMGFGDGSDEFSLPVPRPDMSELGQRQRAAQQGWQAKCR